MGGAGYDDIGPFGTVYQGLSPPLEEPINANITPGADGRAADIREIPGQIKEPVAEKKKMPNAKSISQSQLFMLGTTSEVITYDNDPLPPDAKRTASNMWQFQEGKSTKWNEIAVEDRQSLDYLYLSNPKGQLVRGPTVYDLSSMMRKEGASIASLRCIDSSLDVLRWFWLNGDVYMPFDAATSGVFEQMYQSYEGGSSSKHTLQLPHEPVNINFNTMRASFLSRRNIDTPILRAHGSIPIVKYDRSRHTDVLMGTERHPMWYKMHACGPEALPPAVGADLEDALQRHLYVPDWNNMPMKSSPGTADFKEVDNMCLTTPGSDTITPLLRHPKVISVTRPSMTMAKFQVKWNEYKTIQGQDTAGGVVQWYWQATDTTLRAFSSVETQAIEAQYGMFVKDKRRSTCSIDTEFGVVDISLSEVSSMMIGQPNIPIHRLVSEPRRISISTTTTSGPIMSVQLYEQPTTISHAPKPSMASITPLISNVIPHTSSPKSRHIPSATQQFQVQGVHKMVTQTPFINKQSSKAPVLIRHEVKGPSRTAAVTATNATTTKTRGAANATTGNPKGTVNATSTTTNSKGAATKGANASLKDRKSAKK